MVDPEIQTAINIIDKKIQSLQHARNQLALAFGVGDADNGGDADSRTNTQIRTVVKAAIPAIIQAAAQKPRKEALAEFLLQHGPMSRAAIVEQAGLPEGTISYCLSDKRFFQQLPTGDWEATEYSRKGFQKRGVEIEPAANDFALNAQ